jgi:hypothetical protein
MAEISEKNIIFSVDVKKNELLAETEKTAKAVTSLDKDLKKAGTDADKSFSTAGKSLKEYNNLIRQGEQRGKALTREIREQQKITNEFQARLGVLNTRLQNVSKSSVEFRKLTKEANQLKEAIQDNNVAIKGLKLEKAQVDETVNSFKELAKGSNESAAGLRDVEGALSRVSPEFSRASSGAQGLIRTLTSIGPLGAVIGAGLVAIVGPISLAFTRIQSRSDELRVRLAGLRVTFDRFLDSAARFGDRILSGDFFRNVDAAAIGRGTSLEEQARQAAERRKEQIQASKEAQEIERESLNLQDQRIAFIEREAQLEAIIADSREKISSEETTRIEAIKAIEEAESAINELFGKRVEFQQKENQLLVRKNALTISGRAEAEQEAQNAAELFNLQRQQSEAIKTLNRDKRRALNIDKESLKITEKQADAIKRAAEGSIANIRETIAILQNQLDQEATIEGRFRLFTSLEEAKKELKLIEEQLLLFQSRLSTESPLVEILPGRVEGADPLAAAFERSKNAISDFNKALADDDEAKKLLERNAQELLQIAKDLTASFLQEETRRKDQQIEIARDRINSFRALAEQGSAEQLQIEEDRLAALIEARERAAQRERQIAAIQIAAANAVAIAEGIKNITQAFGKGIINGIASSIALAATIGSTILAIRNATASIPAFKDGTEFVHGPGGGRDDKITAKLSRGERVVDAKKNKELGGISNSRLVEAVKFYDTHHKIKSHEFRGGSHFSDSNIVSEIRYMREEIRDLQMTMRVDEYGLSAGLERATRRRQRVKNLR